MLNDKCLFLYIIFSGLVALSIFLYGYVPVFLPPMNSASHQVVPRRIDGFSVDPKDLYKSHVQKFVLIVVDSLSIDMLTDTAKTHDLPHTLRLIERGDACIVPYNMPPPSTTIKKIKTMATGTTSSFIETFLTFTTGKLKMDNIFRQAKENKLFLSLHGPETWTQLFSDNFYRAKTFDALKVLEYAEVDADMTKAIITEMNKDDWNWFLFHYTRIKPPQLDRYLNSTQLAIRLRELDGIIKFAHTKLAAQKDEYMILVVGDTEIGNLNEFYKNPERIAPYILIGKTCQQSRPTKLMDQLDLAPTLAVLTGLPIPALSYGSLSSAFLNSLTDDQLLFALHYNTAKLVNLTLQLNIEYAEDPAHLLFQRVIIQHGQYLRRTAKPHNQLQLRDTISTTYTRIPDGLSKRINDFLNTADVPIQYLAFVLAVEAMIMLVNQSDKETINKRLNFLVISVTNLLILTWVLATGISKPGTSFIHMTRAKGFVIATVTILMFCNSYIMASQKSFLVHLLSASKNVMQRTKKEISTISSRFELAKCEHEKMSSFTLVLVLGTIFHAFSLLQLSYIKWEKSVWYFLWTTICCFIICKRIEKFYHCATPSNDQELMSNSQNAKRGIISVIFSVLIMHRTIMAYTTVEYWLSHSSNHLCASICLIFGLLLLAFACSIYYEPFACRADKLVTRVLLGLICCAIYMANAARGNVILPYYPKSDGALEIILFWFAWTFIMGYGLGFYTIRTCYKGLRSARQLVATAITCWACFAALLTTSHRLLLIPIEMLFGQAMSDVFKKNNQSFIISHVWLGHLFFHYQRYTYSLSSVDTATGLLFSKNMCSLIFGVLVVVHIFSAPILSYLICVYGILDNNPKRRVSNGISDTNSTFGYCQFLLISVYLLGMLVHRHNEWFWSILSPKLLYETVYTFLIAAAMIVAQISGVFHNLILRLRIRFTDSMHRLH